MDKQQDPQNLDNIFRILKSRFPLDNEKLLQAAIEKKLIENGVEFNREHRLSEKDIPDFFISNQGIAIEAKIKGKIKDIYKQCSRYCAHDQVKMLILTTNRTIGLPQSINNKPVYIINLGKAWL